MMSPSVYSGYPPLAYVLHSFHDQYLTCCSFVSFVVTLLEIRLNTIHLPDRPRRTAAADARGGDPASRVTGRPRSPHARARGARARCGARCSPRRRSGAFAFAGRLSQAEACSSIIAFMRAKFSACTFLPSRSIFLPKSSPMTLKTCLKFAFEYCVRRVDSGPSSSSL